MSELVQRLHALRPLVEDICRVSGAAGVSVGIIHNAKVLMTDNFGFRDVKRKIPPDQDTIYYLASLSKSFTAAGFAHLIRETPGLNWDTPVAEAYQPLSHENPEIRDNVTIADCLSHRSGLAPKNHIWSSEYAHFTLRRGEDIRIFTYLEKLADRKTRWIYNNWGYGAADEIIEHRSSEASWGKYLQRKIFDPLGMTRTVTLRQKDDDNVAKPYMALKNGDLWQVEYPDGEDGEILEGALSVRSCVRDLLNYYMSFMRAVKSDTTGQPDTHDEPFIDAARMVEPHIRLSTEASYLDGAYGLGWIRVTLPCTLGSNGMNHGFLGKMPIVAKGIAKKTTCWYHQGSANSFLTSVHLLPDSQSGVVVLTNSMAQNDIADWLGELYIEQILDSPEKNDYVELARNSAKAALALWPGMREELARLQSPNTPIRPLQDYVGLYYNRIGNFRVEISTKNDQLFLRFQREKRIAYDLKHYHYDTFSWLITHDQNVKVGRFPITRASFYLIQFQASQADSTLIDSLIWIHDDKVLEGETFFKKGGESEEKIEALRVPLEGIGEASMSNVETLAKVLEDGKTPTKVPDAEGQKLREAAVVNTQLDEKTGKILVDSPSARSY